MNANSWFATFLPMFVSLMTPGLRQFLTSMALELMARARSTESPYDDMAAAALLVVLGIETPKSQ